jgi:hypothetical protein
MTTSNDTPIVTPAYGPVPAIYVPWRSDPQAVSVWRLVRRPQPRSLRPARRRGR